MVERTRAELLLDSWEEDESEERDDSASPSKVDQGTRSRKSLADIIDAISEWLESGHDEDHNCSSSSSNNNNSADESIVNDRTEIVYRLKQEATRFETRRRLDTEAYTASISLQELLAEFIQRSVPGGRGKQEGSNRNAVTLSTIHRAKGLEWPVVFLVQMNETVMPSWQALKSCDASAEASEDEQGYGAPSVSRFVLEIPETLVTANRGAEEQQQSDKEESEDSDDSRGSDVSEDRDSDSDNSEEGEDGARSATGGVGGRLMGLFRPLKKRGLMPRTADPVQPKRTKRVVFVRNRRRRSATAESLHTQPTSPPLRLSSPSSPSSAHATPPLKQHDDEATDDPPANSGGAGATATFPATRRFLRRRSKLSAMRAPLARQLSGTANERAKEKAEDQGCSGDGRSEGEGEGEEQASDEDEDEIDTPEEKEDRVHILPARRYVSPNSKQNMKSRSRESVHGPAPTFVLL